MKSKSGHPIGNINSDGIIDLHDIIELSDSINKGNFLNNGDMCGDRSNNILDIIVLVNCILKGKCHG